MAKKMKIFISYSHKNEVSSKELTQLLKKNNETNIFIDEELPAGNWEDYLFHKISNCDIALLYISTDFINSLKNGYIKKEYMKLFEKWINEEDFMIIPVQLAPYSLDKELELELNKFQWFRPSGKEYNIKLDENNFYFQGLNSDKDKMIYSQNLFNLINNSYQKRKERKKYQCIKAQSLKLEDFLSKIRIHKLSKSFYYHRRYDDEINQYVQNGYSVFIFGAPNSGKSTLVFNALKKLNNRYVVFCKNNTKFFAKNLKGLKKLYNEYGNKLVVFFDDINQYFIQDTVDAILFCQQHNVQIVATCRNGEERNLIYFEEQFYKEINIKALRKNDIKKIKDTLFSLYNLKITKDFFRIGSFFNDDLDIRNKYFQLTNQNVDAKNLMICIQILYNFKMYKDTSFQIHRSTLKKTFEYYISQNVSHAVFNELLNFLSSKHLIYFDNDWIWTEELFLDNFVDKINPFLYLGDISYAEEDPNYSYKSPEIDLVKLFNQAKNINNLLNIIDYMKTSFNTYHLNLALMQINTIEDLILLTNNQYVKKLNPNTHNLQVLLSKRKLNSKKILDIDYFQNIKLNVFNFTTLISNAISLEKAEELFREMVAMGIESNQYTYTAMMKHCKDFSSAEIYFNKIKNNLRENPNEYAWATLIEASETYTRAKKISELKEFKVSAHALTSLMKKLKFYEKDKQQKIVNIFNLIIDSKIIPDTELLTALMSKTEDFIFAQKVFSLFNKYNIKPDIQAVSVYIHKHKNFNDVKLIYERYIKDIVKVNDIKLYSMMLSSARETKEINYITEEIKFNNVEMDLWFIQTLYKKRPLKSYDDLFWKKISSTKLRLLVNSRYWAKNDIEYICNLGVDIFKTMILTPLLNRAVYNLLEKEKEKDNIDEFIDSMPCFFSKPKAILWVANYINYPLEKTEQSLKLLKRISLDSLSTDNLFNYYRLYALCIDDIDEKIIFSKKALDYAKDKQKQYMIYKNLAKDLHNKTEDGAKNLAIKNAFKAYSSAISKTYRQYVVDDILQYFSFEEISRSDEYDKLPSGLKEELNISWKQYKNGVVCGNSNLSNMQ